MSPQDSIPKTQRQWHLPEHNGWKSLTIHEVPVQTPGPGEVLVKIHAVALNFRDLLIAENKYVMQLKPGTVPCSDAAGEIVALGEGVSGWHIGERVTPTFSLTHLRGPPTPATAAAALGAEIPGVLAQFRVLPAAALVRVPNHLSWEEASSLCCAGITAWSALEALKPGDTILVEGTGGVSVLALQLAAARGARVFATSSSDAKLAVAQSLGAQELINYKKTPDWEKEVLRLTGGEGVDVVLDQGGNVTLPQSMAAARIGGTVCIVGGLGGFDAPPVDVVLPAIMRNLTLRAAQVGSREQYEQIMRFLDATKLRPKVDKVFAFEEAGKAFEHFDAQRHVGKVVIQVVKP